MKYASEISEDHCFDTHLNLHNDFLGRYSNSCAKISLLLPITDDDDDDDDNADEGEIEL